MKQKFLFLTVIPLYLTLAGCGFFLQQKAQTQDVASPSSQYKTFQSEKLGVTFQYPAAWDAGGIWEDEVMEQAFFMFDPTCIKQCKGLFLQVRTKANYEYEYNNIIADYNSHPDQKPYTGYLNKWAIPQDTGKFLITSRNRQPATQEEHIVEIYNKKDTIYIFHFPQTESFGSILGSFSEIPKVSMPTAIPASVSPQTQFAFDGCGSLQNYQSQTFFEDFHKKILSLDRYRLSNDRKFEGSTKISDKDIGEVCYSEKGKMVLALIPGRYCETGEIIRYKIDTGEMEYADTGPARKKSRCASLSSFGKRKGNIIEVKGGWGDAGCTSDFFFHYDYQNNLVDIKRSCGRCYDESTGKKEPDKCEEY